MALTVTELMDVKGRKVRGRVVSATRRLKVEGITSTNQLDALAEVLADPGVPASGALIVINTSVLYATSHDVDMNEDGTMAVVTVEYEGGVSTATSGSEVSRGGDSALAQVRSTTDRSGNEITVNFGGTLWGTTQRAEVNALEPQASPWRRTLEATADPDALVSQWLGYVNSATWLGKAAGKWIVSRVRYEELNPEASTPLYTFFWQFQESTEAQGWLPVVAYVDPETNRMPDGLVVGTGIKSVPWYNSRDFNSKFT